jgi:hypothetical protein
MFKVLMLGAGGRTFAPTPFVVAGQRIWCGVIARSVTVLTTAKRLCILSLCT